MTLPSGTVTFLFTDVEGSTKLLHEHGERYADLLAEHRRLLRDAFFEHGGVEVDTQGDAFFYAFQRAADALAAARVAQAALDATPVRVRIGIHTGEPLVTDEGYVGLDVHTAARIAAAGHGGQVLVSEQTARLLEASNTVLLADLGLHRLKDLGEPLKLYQAGEGDFPPLKSLNATNLPAQPSALVGRERELEELTALVRGGARLVTVTGPGGTGKTRLALQAAAELVDEFRDGVFWVPLQALADPELVLATIASTLGARGELHEHVDEKRMLLLLDNLEQLLPEAASPLAELLARCPNLRLLVTSRALLRIAPERDYALEPLPLDDAVTLFRERAADAEPEEAVLAICRRLEGLPLALELAAARTRILPPEKLLARLERALPLLTGGARDAPERQRTLTATIAWSYELLSEEEQRLFRRLSVFAGGFELEAAEEVCEAELDTLESLLEKSLLRRWASGRLGMLETIREYAAERLEESGEAEVLRRRQLAWLQALVVRARETIFETKTMAALDGELANLRAVADWLKRRGYGRELMNLGAYVWIYLLQRTPYEGRTLLEAGLALSAEETEERVRVLTGLSQLTLVTGDLAVAAHYAGEGLAVSRRLDLARGQRASLVALGVIRTQQGRFAEAQTFYEESASVAERIGDADGVSEAKGALADLALYRGDFEQAEERAREMLALLGGRDSQRAMMLLNLGFAALKRGAADVSLEAAKEALTILRGVGPTPDLRGALEVVAAIAVGHDVCRAAMLLGASEALEPTVGVLPAFELSVRRESLERLHSHSRDEWADCWEQGTQLEPLGALKIALEACDRLPNVLA